MPRQFSLKTLLWLMAVAGAFFAGAVWQKHLHALKRPWRNDPEFMELPDGSIWRRVFDIEDE
ncbi:MAG TPA: hypothetical protein VHC22_01460 [Pirellulales bacterium]|nr:hypothetical protein [Pirellulales bacterium]